MRTISQLTLTATEAAVLGLLTRGPMSGYDLRKRIDRSIGYFWAPAKTQIYAVLPRLVEAGLATKRDVPQSGRPDKQVYRITRAGREALRSWLNHGPVEPAPDKNPMLLKLFFGDDADRDALAEQVRQRRETGEELLAALEEIEQTKPLPGRGDDFYPSFTRLWGRMYGEALVRWADEVLARIEQADE